MCLHITMMMDIVVYFGQANINYPAAINTRNIMMMQIIINKLITTG